MSEIIKSYKGFNKDMTCRGFRYEEGKEYETERAEVCEEGFHACEYPLDCFGYYPPCSSVYHVVEQSGELSKDGGDSKVASSKIKIGTEIGIPGLVKAAVEYTKERITSESETTNSGYQGAATNSGDRGAATNSGDRGAATNSGYRGAATNSGDRGAATNSGDRGAATNSGDRGAATNSGYQGAATNSGDRGAATNSGDRGAATNSGYQGAAISTGEESAAISENGTSIAISWGVSGKAKGVIGSHIVLADWHENADGECELKGAKMIVVDGDKYKENTFYIIKNGEVVEEEEA